MTRPNPVGCDSFVPSDDGYIVTIDCHGNCRTVRGRRRRTAHIVRPGRLVVRDEAVHETTCTVCLRESFTTAAGNVLEKTSVV